MNVVNFMRRGTYGQLSNMHHYTSQHQKLKLKERLKSNAIQSKQNGALEIAVKPGYSQCSHIEKVRESMFKMLVQCLNTLIFF